MGSRVSGLLLAALLGVLASGCTADVSPSRAPQSSGSIEPATQLPPGKPWPFDAYQMSEEQGVLWGKAMRILQDDCLRRHGFEPVQPAPFPPSEALTVQGPILWRVSSIADPRLGYRQPPNPASDQYNEDMAAYQRWYDAHRPSAAYQLVESGRHGDGGCYGEAQARLSHGSHRGQTARWSAFIKPLDGLAWQQASADPRLLTAMGRWSDCMADKGFDYGTTWEASADDRWGNTESATPLEIRTATADVACQWKTNVNDVWNDTMIGYQDKLIEQHAEEFAAFKKGLAGELAAIQSVLEGTSPTGAAG
jgi:hypothetical protein